VKHKFWVLILAGIIALGLTVPAFTMGGVRSTHSNTVLLFKEYDTGSGAAIHFGVDDDGLDVKFFGATSGAYALWDESADAWVFNAISMHFGDSDYILFGDDGDGDIKIGFDGTQFVLVANTDDTVAIHFGSSTKASDLKWFDTGSGYVQFDAGNATVVFEDVDQYMNDDDQIFFGDGGAEGRIYSDGTDLIISGDTCKLYGETFTVMCKFGTVAASTDDERPVFVAPFDCTITAAYLMDATGLATSATAITTITLNDKGAGGSGNNAIAAWNCGAAGTVMTAFDPLTMGALDGTHKLLTALDSVTLKKVDTGGVGAGTDEMILMLTYERR